MTAHELAKKLLEGPDVPVCMYDWSSGDEIPTLIQYAQGFVGTYSVFEPADHSFRVRGRDTRLVLLDSSGHPWDEKEGLEHLEEHDEKYSNPER